MAKRNAPNSPDMGQAIAAVVIDEAIAVKADNPS